MNQTATLLEGYATITFLSKLLKLKLLTAMKTFSKATDAINGFN